MENIEPDFSKINIEDQPQTLEKPQQSFSFDNEASPKREQVSTKNKYNLPEKIIFSGLIISSLKFLMDSQPALMPRKSFSRNDIFFYS